MMVPLSATSLIYVHIGSQNIALEGPVQFHGQLAHLIGHPTKPFLELLVRHCIPSAPKQTIEVYAERQEKPSQ